MKLSRGTTEKMARPAARQSRPKVQSSPRVTRPRVRWIRPLARVGGGTVGAAVARGLASRAEEWGIGIAGIAVRDLAKAQAAGLDRIAPLTTDPAALAASDDVDVVVELMGGLDPAMPIVEAALKAGRPVVTANKLLLATFGARLESLARASDTALRFESAVAAGVPVIGVLARDMSANEIPDGVPPTSGAAPSGVTGVSSSGSLLGGVGSMVISSPL